MTQIIFPTENDIGAVTNDGRAFTEDNWLRYYENGNHLNHWRTGGTVSSTGTSPPTVTFTAFDCIIGGFLVRETASITTPALTISTTNYIYYTLTKSAGLVTGADFTILTTLTTPPADSIYMGDAVTNTTAVISTTVNHKQNPWRHTGSYTGDGTGGFSVVLGYQPALVLVGRSDAVAGSFLCKMADHAATKSSDLYVDGAQTSMLDIQDYGFSIGLVINTATIVFAFHATT